MNLLIAYRKDKHKGQEVPCYAGSFIREFKALGHRIDTIGFNQDFRRADEVSFSNYDLFLEIDNGRGPDGQFNWIQPEKRTKNCPTAVILTDSHGQPDLHQQIAKDYDHVFFAVYFRRDLFTGHNSAHWLPNATDLEWFSPDTFGTPKFQFGFFGSKGGLNRADAMVDICKSNGWTYDVRQINGAYKPKWPFTAEAMRDCKFLFNHGQKHDVNLRIFESMAVGRPLICDFDPSSGIDKLFQPGVHFTPYESYTYRELPMVMDWMVNNSEDAILIAKKAYEEICNKHLIKHRVNQILEVVDGSR